MSTQSAPQSDNRFVLFRYRNHSGTEIVIGASLAWLVAVIVLAVFRPEVFGFPAMLMGLWKSWRG